MPASPESSSEGDRSPVAAATGERTLTERLRAGDETAFDELVGRHHGSLVRLARLFVSSPASAEEVAQETWLAVIQGLAKFEGRSSLKTWIFRILTNRAKTRATREGRMIPVATLHGDDGDDDEPALDRERFNGRGGWAQPPRRWQVETPEGMLLRAEVRESIARILTEMPPTQAAVVNLRDVEGWSSREVCNALSLSETNQRVLLHRGRSRLRRALEEVLGRE